MKIGGKHSLEAVYPSRCTRPERQMLLCRGSGVTGRCCWTFFGRVWARPGEIGARNVFIQISVRFLSVGWGRCVPPLDNVPNRYLHPA